MKALKSISVQILIIGAIICAAMYKFINEVTIPTIFATGFTTLVAGRKVRDAIQSSKGQYFDEDAHKLKNAE